MRQQLCCTLVCTLGVHIYFKIFRNFMRKAEKKHIKIRYITIIYKVIREGLGLLVFLLNMYIELFNTTVESCNSPVWPVCSG